MIATTASNSLQSMLLENGGIGIIKRMLPPLAHPTWSHRQITDTTISVINENVWEYNSVKMSAQSGAPTAQLPNLRKVTPGVMNPSLSALRVQIRLLPASCEARTPDEWTTRLEGLSEAPACSSKNTSRDHSLTELRQIHEAAK